MRPAPNRFPMAILMGFIGVLAVGLGGMRNGSAMAAKVAFNVLLVTLMIALLGAIVRREDGAWAGFALFGWTYAFFALVPAIQTQFGPSLLADDLLNEVITRLHPGPGPKPLPPTFPGGYTFKLRDVRRDFLADSSLDFPDLTKILSADELEMLKAHLNRLDSHEKLQETWYASIKDATEIGHSLLALMAGLVGAVLGRALSKKSRPAAGLP